MNWAKKERPEFLLRTDGVVAALRLCGSQRAEILAWIRIIPRTLRDAGYRCVAHTRFRIWGKWDASCPLPRPEWRGRFWE